MDEPAHSKVEKQGRNLKQSSMTTTAKCLNNQGENKRKQAVKNQHAHQETVTTTQRKSEPRQ